MRKLLLFLFAFLFVLNFVAASPPNPMAFYGDVIYSGGIPDGYYITAKIGSVVHGQCLIINNKYGYGENTCIVVSYDSGVLVNFYIGSIWIGNYDFEAKEIVHLDFTLESLPQRPQPLSNGICEPNLGECSFNFLDCQISLTNACAGNSRCDVEIGETCATTPSDCGICPTSSGGGGSGGSSGGGGSSGTTTLKTLGNQTSQLTGLGQETSGESESLNGGSSTDTKKGINWLTGAIIGVFGDINTLFFVTLIVLIVVAFMLFFVARKKENKNINKKIKEMIKRGG